MEPTTKQENSRKVELKQFERSPKFAEIRAVYRSRTKVQARRKIREPEDVTEYLREIWNPRTLELNEEFILLCLNNAHQVIGWVKIASGGISCAQVDPRVIFAIALQTASSSLVLAHNHPSGNTAPSEEDLRVTSNLVQAGKLLNIRVLDHIILTKESAFSFREHELI